MYKCRWTTNKKTFEEVCLLFLEGCSFALSKYNDILNVDAYHNPMEFVTNIENFITSNIVVFHTPINSIQRFMCFKEFGISADCSSACIAGRGMHLYPTIWFKETDIETESFGDYFPMSTDVDKYHDIIEILNYDLSAWSNDIKCFEHILLQSLIISIYLTNEKMDEVERALERSNR